MKQLEEKTSYLPGLDGLRAVAILAVIFYHDTSHSFGRGLGFIHDKGSYGVDLFFAISGILICTRLLDEETRRERISLLAFYIRRLFRIFPAAWFFLLTCALLAFLKQLPSDTGGVLASLLMIRNFWVQHAGDTPNHWYTIHFWSLSVEEHFYLLLPGVLAICGPRKRTPVLCLLTVISLLWMEAVLHFRSLQVQGVWLRSDFRMAALLIPASIAVLLTHFRGREIATRRLMPVVVVSLIISSGLLLSLSASPKVGALKALIVPVGFPLIVVSTMLHPQSIMTRVLELFPVRFIGHISYSLYLWQQLFFLDLHRPAAWPLSELQQFPVNYFAAFSCAIVSYYLLEKPFIPIGRRLAWSLTLRHLDLSTTLELQEKPALLASARAVSVEER